MNGPLDEKARADATAMTSPVVRRRGDATTGVITGSEAVETVMGGIRLSGVKCAYTGDSIGEDVRSQHGFHS